MNDPESKIIELLGGCCNNTRCEDPECDEVREKLHLILCDHDAAQQATISRLREELAKARALIEQLQREAPTKIERLARHNY